MPLVWAAGVAHMGRVYGPDLLLALCALAPSGLVLVPLRSGEGVPGAARQGLAVRFPGAVGCRYHVAAIPATDPEEDAAVIERINAATPGLVWVGLSTPNQER